MPETLPERDPLEVLADEFTARQRRGETPSIDDYAARYPELAEEIREVFPTVAVMERLKIHKEQSSGPRASLGAVRLERLGDFRIVGEIGRGGMGIVYDAFQESLGRHVAVKVLPRQSLLDPKQLQRFQREAQTAARLHHTNIVPVFGVGEHDGFHYIVMQLIPGVGLDVVLAQFQTATASEHSLREGPPRSEAARLARALVEGDFRPPSEGEGGSSFGTSGAQLSQSGPVLAGAAPSPSAAITEDFSSSNPVIVVAGQPEREPAPAAAAPAIGPAPQFGAAYWRSVAQIGQQVAAALQYAHTHHTLHRDIKPANLLLDSQGVVWITDFGLAKAMEQDNLTQAGGLVGTLRYMSPEQFSGHADARSDVYSLGLTLYELLTLRPAFADDSRSSLIRKITHEEPLAPRKLQPKVPRDLETIVLKAVAREPRDRYQSAGELARDLECFLDDRPIVARRTSAGERLWRWSRRNRALAGLTASTFALLVLVAVVASVGYVRTTQANVQEALHRKKAEDTSALALEALDNIFQQFAPDRATPASALVVAGESTDDVTVPVQPVLSKEAAALLAHLLAFYDRLAVQGGDDARLRGKVAEANRRVGDIRQRLGQYAESKAAYRSAIELYTNLAAAGADAGLRTAIARIQNELGNVYCASNDPEAGRACFHEALAILTASADDAPTPPQYRYELARTYYFLGRRFDGQTGPPPLAPGGRRGHHGGPGGSRDSGPGGPQGSAFLGRDWAGDDTAARLRSALELWLQMAADDGPWPVRQMHGPHGNEGGPPPDRPEQADGPPPKPNGPPREDGESIRKAIDLLDRLIAEYPTVPDYRHLLARCYRELPSSRFGRGPQVVAGGASKAATILEKLVQEYPDVPDYRYDLSETYAWLGAAGPFSTEAPEGNSSRAMLEKAMAISEELVAEHPNIPDYAVSQVQIRVRLAHAQWESDPARTEAGLRKALELQSTLVRRFPQNAFYKFGIAVVRESLAVFLREQNRWVEARTLLEESTATLEESLRSDAQSRPVRGLLGHTYMVLADLLERMGETKAATEAARRADALRPGR